MLGTLLRDLRYAARSLRREPAFARGQTRGIEVAAERAHATLERLLTPKGGPSDSDGIETGEPDPGDQVRTMTQEEARRELELLKLGPR